MTETKHTPGDVNHQVLAAAKYDFCPTCGVSLNGKRTVLEAEILEALGTLLRHGSFPTEIQDRAIAVIKKAKGE